MIIPRRSAAVLAAVLFSTTFHIAFAANLEARLAKEATAIILKSRGSRELRDIFAAKHGPSRCMIQSEWEAAVVPEYFARKYLGSNLRGNVATQNHEGIFRTNKIVDPDSAFPQSFCDLATQDKFGDDILKSLNEGNSSAIPVFKRISFSFPIFNHRIDKAVLVVARAWDTRDGITHKRSADLAVFAIAFVKRAGKWHAIATELLTIT